MLIEKPRVPHRVEVDGKERIRVGYAQMLALMLLDKLGPTDKPPEGVLSATGILREHIFNDMVPLKYVEVKVPMSGHAQYYLTALGRQALRDGVYKDPPKKARKEFGTLMSLIQRMRIRGKRQHAASGLAGRRAA